MSLPLPGNRGRNSLVKKSDHCHCHCQVTEDEIYWSRKANTVTVTVTATPTATAGTWLKFAIGFFSALSIFINMLHLEDMPVKKLTYLATVQTLDGAGDMGACSSPDTHSQC